LASPHWTTFGIEASWQERIAAFREGGTKAQTLGECGAAGNRGFGFRLAPHFLFNTLNGKAVPANPGCADPMGGAKMGGAWFRWNSIALLGNRVCHEVEQTAI